MNIWLQLFTAHYFLSFMLLVIALIGVYWLLINAINAVKCMVVAYFNRHKKYHDDMDDEDD